jgi:undecaprenyl-diphosphatase
MMTISEEAACSARRDSSPLVLLGGLAVAALLLFVMLKLGSELLEGEGAAFDRAILLVLRVPGHPDLPVGPLWLRVVMRDITGLGGGTQLTLLVLTAAGLLIARQAIRTALLLVVATASGGFLVALLKDRFGRPRPTLVDHLVEVHSASFPSGHAANSAIVFLTIATLVARVETTRRERIYTLAIAMLLTLLVGISRVYLGVHWPSDVLAGWLLGAGWAALWWVVANALPASSQMSQN